MRAMDLNADLGEGTGADDALMEIITSASIACGGHAGDDATMRAAVRAAVRHGVVIGAHPGFVDPEHFGRRRLDLPVTTVAGQVLAQIDVLSTIARSEGAVVRYVKLHGALANMAAEDLAYAHGILAPIAETYPQLAVLALEHSAQEMAAKRLKMPYITEAYADRAYLPNGQLVSRSEPGAVLHAPVSIVERCVRLAETGAIEAIDGTILASTARSICIHGDTPDAVDIAREIRDALSRIVTLASPLSGGNLTLPQ
jgi:5-oxoprolinase (ATP-hydrolysing) subunit A